MREHQRAGIEDGDDAVARIGAAALVLLHLHGGDAAVFRHAHLHADVAFGAAAMGDEGFFAVDDEAHASLALACQQPADQLDLQRLGAAAEAAADEAA